MLFNGCFSSVTKESIESLFLFVDTSTGCLIVSLYVYLFSFVLNFFKCE